MNKKGFVLSTYVYILLVFFLLLLGTMLAVMNNTKLLSNKLKEQSSSTSGLSDKDYSFMLLGDKNMDVFAGTEYEEPGFIAKTSKGVDISDNVKVMGSIDMNTMNKYTLTYKITYNGISKELKRNVNVVKVEDAEFAYTGKEAEFIAPASGYYQLEVWGAQGGSYSTTYSGGLGGKATGVVYLERNDKLYVYVGGQGENASSGNGGYNGGGNGVAAGSYSGYPGGGATDVRFFGDYKLNEGDLIWNSELGLNSRIMIAAGGGGAGKYLTTYYSTGGAAGGLVGVAGTSTHSESTNLLNAGGTQSNGGYNSYTAGLEDVVAGGFGYGGAGTRGSTYGNSGGGSGYYGGAGGPEGLQPGGGGSSFISGYAGVNAITSSSDRTHTNNTLHYSNKYFIDGEMQAGVNSGNGKATITYLGTTYEKKNTKLNNVRYVKDCINGSNINGGNHWVELQTIKNGSNVAKDKNVTGPSPVNSTYPYNRVTDGDITTTNYSEPSVSGSLQCITVDLGTTNNLDEIAVWHYYNDNRSYNNHSLYVSSDNTNWTTLLDNVSGVIETANGIRVSAYD